MVLRGGAGEDSLSFSAGLAGNATLLDGGAEADMAFFDYSQFELRVDLSDSFDATLPDGVRLRNIEVVSILGGSADGIFPGGDDDDGRDAGVGSDAAKGGTGNDALSNSILSYASDGATDVHSGDVDALLGGAGQDDLVLSVLAFAHRGGSATVSGNATVLDDDTLSMSALPETYQDGGEPGTAALSGNTFTLLSKGGRNFINAFLGASADEGGTASTTDNAVLLRGGSMADTLQFAMSATAFAAAGGGSTTTTRGNVVTVMGDGGGDTLSPELEVGANSGSNATLVNNTLALTGGSGNDRLFVGYDLGLQDGGRRSPVTASCSRAGRGTTAWG